jgi:hypothetical protein
MSINYRLIKNMQKIIFQKPEGKRPLRRSRSSWEGNIRMDLREIGFRDVDGIHLA